MVEFGGKNMRRRAGQESCVRVCTVQSMEEEEEADLCVGMCISRTTEMALGFFRSQFEATLAQKNVSLGSVKISFRLDYGSKWMCFNFCLFQTSIMRLSDLKCYGNSVLYSR